MRLHPIGLAAALLAVVAVANVRALGDDASSDSRRSMGNLRLDSREAGQAIQGVQPRGTTRSRTVVVPRPVYPYGGYSPYYSGYPGYYSPGYGYYPYPPSYGYPRFYHRGYLYPPPVYLPAERLYGPQALRRFMGVGP